MSTNQTKTSSADDQIAFAKVAVFGLTAVAAFKFLPMVVVGLFMGGIVTRGAAGAVRFERVRLLSFGLLFFAIPVFALCGLPIAAEMPRVLQGVISDSDTLQGLVKGAIGLWNSNFPKVAIIKAIRFDGLVTTLDVSRYFWLAIEVATLLVVSLEVWRRLRPQDLTKRPEINLVAKICQLPARAIEMIIHGLFTRWFNFGQGIAHLRVHTWARRIVWATLYFCIIGFGAVTVGGLIFYIFMSSPNQPLGEIAASLSVCPGIGFGLGFLRGGVNALGISLATLFPDLFKRSSEDRGAEFYLGNDNLGRSYSLSEKNLSYHVEVIAPTGSGKTNLLKNLIADRIHRGHGIIFLDLKAEFQVVTWMMRVAMAAGRESELRLVSLANRELSVPYNPIKHGSAPEIHSQLMNSMTWSEDYYRKISSMALMTLLRGLCEYRDRMGEYFHLGHLHDLLNEPGWLRSFNEKLLKANCPAARDVAMLAEKLDRPSERDKLTGLVANLGLLIHSAAGPLISDDVRMGSFDFREAVDEGRITYVLMNSLKLRETASVFGKMILQDLMRLAGDRYSELDGAKRHRPVTLVIDEFAAFAIPEFIEFMDRARGAGIGIVFAHQSRADLRAITPEFQDRIEANSNTVIVSGVKSSEDAEYFAGILGTRTVQKETVQAKDDFFGTITTGMKSIRETEEYVVHPNRLKDLHQGEIFTVSRTVDPRWSLLKVPQAEEFLENPMKPAELVTRLEAIRKAYMSDSKEKYLDLATTDGKATSDVQVRPAKQGVKLPNQESERPKPDQTGANLWS